MIVSFIAALQIAATLPAVRIETTTTSESTGAVPQPGVNSHSVMTLSGSKFRLEELDRTGPETPFNKAGTVMLARPDQKKMISLDPAKKEYYEIDLTKMQSQISAMFKSMPGMQMKFSDFKTNVQDLGDGEALLGHPTRHYKITTSMTMNAIMAAESLSVSSESSSETWFAKDIHADDNTMAADTTVLVQFGEIIPGIDARRFREQLAKLPKLVPLKSVSTTSSYFGPMDVTVKVTQLATKVERIKVPASTFEVPAGYKKIAMPALTGPPRQ